MKKLIILLICLFACLQVNAKQLKFVQVSDVSFSSSEASSNKQILELALKSINMKKPQFVVFLGNNIEKSKEKELTEFLKTIKTLKMPYYITLGSSDAHKLSGMSKEDFWKTVNKYNKNNKSKKTYYLFNPNKEITGIVLDGAVPYMQNSHGIFPEEQLSRLDKELSKNKNKKFMIFQYFPVIEPYDNPSYTVLNKEEYKNVIDKHDNIILISSGRYNKSKVTTDEKGIYHISSPALSKPNHVYDIVTIDYSKIPFGKIKIKEITVTPVELK